MLSRDLPLRAQMDLAVQELTEVLRLMKADPGLTVHAARVQAKNLMGNSARFAGVVGSFGTSFATSGGAGSTSFSSKGHNGGAVGTTAGSAGSSTPADPAGSTTGGSAGATSNKGSGKGSSSGGAGAGHATNAANATTGPHPSGNQNGAAPSAPVSPEDDVRTPARRHSLFGPRNTIDDIAVKNPHDVITLPDHYGAWGVEDRVLRKRAEMIKKLREAIARQHQANLNWNSQETRSLRELRVEGEDIS